MLIGGVGKDEKGFVGYLGSGFVVRRKWEDLAFEG